MQRLLFTDFDGTLTQHQSPDILTANLLALQHWQRAGNEAILVTGRNHSVLPQILPSWKSYFAYIITDNGGAIFDQTDHLCLSRPFSDQLLETVIASTDPDILIAFYTPYSFAAQRPTDQEIIKLRLWFKNLEHLWSVQHFLCTGIIPVKSLPWPKSGFSKLPGVDLSQYCGFLDLVPKTSGKELAISWIADRYDSPKSSILTIGDDYNDIDMLSEFHGYTFTSSPPEVIQSASGRTIHSVAELIYSKLGLATP